MRLQRLHLLRYGHFTDRPIELPAGNSDFHIIFGPNEAGKSTALCAIEDLFFGIPGQTPYGFLHGYNEMRIGALLENGNDTLEVLRRKGNKDTLLGPEGSPVSGGESVLRPYLAGADRTFFERMFSLDHTRLEAGGREILEAKDDVGQMLFSAGAGIAGLRERLTELSTEADELWSARRAKHRKFYIADDKLAEATRELREHTLSATKWRELKQAYEEAEDAYAKIDEAISQAMTLRNRLSRIRRVCRDIRRKQDLDVLLNALGDVITLPEDAAGLVAAAERKEAEVAARIGTLTNQLERANDELGKLTFDETILLRSNDVRQGCERRIEIRGERAHLPKREAELNTAEVELKGDAAELGWLNEDSASLIERIPQRTKVSIVRSLLTQKGELENDVTIKTRLFDEAQGEHDLLKRKLGEAGEPTDASRLAIAAKAVREQGDIAGQVRAAARALKDAQDQVRRRLDVLNPKVADEDALTNLTLPARAQVQAHHEAQQDWNRRHREILQRVSSVQQELDSTAAAFERTVRDERVVTVEELAEARARRDALWQMVKIMHIENRPIPENLAALYKEEIENLAGALKAAVVRTDELADRRFDHAAASGRISEIKRKIGDLETSLQHAQQNQEQIVGEGEKLKADWAALWVETFVEPKAPEAMLEWLEDRHVALEVIEAKELAEGTLEAIRNEEQSAKEELLRELAALGVDIDALAQDGLMTVMGRTEEELKARAAEKDLKSQLKIDIEAAANLTVRRQRDLEAAERALAAWQSQWGAALSNIGLPTDSAAEAVGAQIDIIDQMRETASRIKSLRHDRIEKIRRDIADFENLVTDLVRVVAPDLQEKSADDAVATMEVRLGEAERIKALRDRQVADIEGLKNQLAALIDQQLELVASLSHLKQLAGVDNIDCLKAAIGRSDKQYALQTELQQIVEKLQQDGDGNTLEELEAECEGQVIDDVIAQEASHQAELDNLRTQQAEAAEIRSQTRQAFNAIGGDDTAARAAAKKDEALTEIGEIAERYVRVRTSAMLLQWAIDRYRREKQAPLLKRAGELFQIITGDSFSGLQVAFDDQDNAHLTGVRPDGGVVPVSGLSTGSADQLYLALRVASIENYLDRANSLPFVADDLFINFDDERAAAGFRLLFQLAEKTQVLFFTHHQHLMEIAHKTLGDSVNHVSLNEHTTVAAA